MVFLLKQNKIKMCKKLTLDDLIIKRNDIGQDCDKCAINSDTGCKVKDIYGLYDWTCLTHTITLKPTTDEK